MIATAPHTDRRAFTSPANGARSRGPSTAAGKAASSRNATRHGLLSAALLLPDEDQAAFDRLARRLRKDLRPQGELERVLVERVTAAVWRLRRVLKIEGDILDRYRLDAQGRDQGIGNSFVKDATTGDALSKLTRYESAIERGMSRALHELQRVQAARLGKPGPLPAAVDVTC